jgi:uncharacterized membrane-anchored protein
MTSRPGRVLRAREPLAAKVPEVAVLFWVVKLVTTAVGEAISDFLAQGSLVVAGAVGVVFFGAAMWVQLRARTYSAPVYWLAVTSVAVFGTMAADGLHKGLGVPYAGTTVLYSVILAAVFLRWQRTEATLSIHSILTRQREIYYWLTVLFTFALGTAVGDLTAFTLGLGFLTSILLFAGAEVVVLVAWRAGANPILAFWAGYVLTRPLGASIADWLSKPRSLTGLGWGDGHVALGFAVVLVVLVGYLTVRRADIQEAPRSQRARLRAAMTSRPDYSRKG